jgi:hypothetical protein
VICVRFDGAFSFLASTDAGSGISYYAPSSPPFSENGETSLATFFFPLAGGGAIGQAGLIAVRTTQSLLELK